MKIKWYKLNPLAKIPTKTDKAAGFDIYTIENEVVLEPHTSRLFSTGLGFICDDNYWLMAKDRGSTGSKGIHTHCGVVDVDYRGEIFICLTNTTNYPIYFTSDKKVHDYGPPSLLYNTNKAIAQLIPIEMPIVESEEATEEEWLSSCAKSARGAGKLGSSGK